MMVSLRANHRVSSRCSLMNDPCELCQAVRSRNLAEVRRLLDGGADPNTPASDVPFVGGWTPLHDAACIGDAAIIELLVRAGADVNAVATNGHTPIYAACNAGHLDAARAILDAGADPNVRNTEGYSTLGRVPGNCRELYDQLVSRGGRL